MADSDSESDQQDDRPSESRGVPDYLTTWDTHGGKIKAACGSRAAAPGQNKERSLHVPRQVVEMVSYGQA
ncbi:hypothetical protein ElyMa_004565900, partial [Elysia marginata]